jgi:hypothetical protein
LPDGVPIAVTKDGYIWAGSTFKIGGLLIKVYWKDEKKPLLDWRAQIPNTLETKLTKLLREKV